MYDIQLKVSYQWLSVFGAMQMAQCKWRNGENNRKPDPNPILKPIPNPNPDPNPIPHPTPNPKRLLLPLHHLHCAICIAPNTDSPYQNTVQT